LKQKFGYLLCLVLLLQGGVRLLANAQQLTQLRSQNFNDVELICTGSTMKWISVSLTEQANQFVFVDAPEEANTADVSKLCPNNLLADGKKAVDNLVQFELVQLVSYTAQVSKLNQQPYTAYPYQKALSRGPPINS
jgi:hypothetical protein